MDFAHLVASIAEDARFEAEALGKHVRIDIAGDAQVAGDPALLHRAVENIVRNALRFTREGTSVEVSLRTTDRKALLSVTDHGPGVADEAMPRIFEPFYRGRSEDGAGFGLGLAIAQRAVEAHGGNIAASNVPAAGLRVEMELPLAA